MTNQPYTASCTGPGGTTYATAYLTVGNPPTVSFNAAASSIYIDSGTTTASWSSSGASSCNLGGTSGSTTMGPYSSTGTKSVSVTCSNQFGNTTQTATVNVIHPAPTMSFSVSPSIVAVGGTTTWSWTSTNATSCTYAGVTFGPNGSTAGGPHNTPMTNQPYSATCTGPGGTTSATTYLTVGYPPTVSFSAAASSILINTGSTTASWSSSGATSCNLGGLSGSTTMGPYSTAGTKSASVTCSNQFGSATQTATVDVVHPQPTMNFSVTSPIGVGQNATWSWTSNNATSCTYDGNNFGPSGSYQGGPYNTPMTNQPYSASCTGPGGTVSGTAYLTVVPPPTINTFSLAASQITVNSTTTASWTSTNATSCTLGSGGASGTATVGPYSSPGTKTISLTCTGIGGSTTQTAQLTVPTPPTMTFVADPAVIGVNGNTTWKWTSTDATSCTYDGYTFGPNGQTPGGPYPNLMTNQPYSASCTGPGGTVSATALLSVVSAPDVTSFTVTPNPTVQGQSAVWNWTTTGQVTSCTDGVGALPASGPFTNGPYNTVRTATITGTCTGPGGSDSMSVEHVVVPLTATTTAVTSSSIYKGQSITWRINTNGTSCTSTDGSVTYPINQNFSRTYNTAGVINESVECHSGTVTASTALTGAVSVGAPSVNYSGPLTWNQSSGPVTMSVIATDPNGTIASVKMLQTQPGGGGNLERVFTQQGASSTWSFTYPTQNLPQGSYAYDFWFVATDNEGNVYDGSQNNGIQQFTYIVSPQLPVVSYSGPYTWNQNDGPLSLSVTASDPDGTVVSVKMVQGPGIPIGSPITRDFTQQGSSTTWTYAYPEQNFLPGEYTYDFWFVVTDNNGNVYDGSQHNEEHQFVYRVPSDDLPTTFDFTDLTNQDPGVVVESNAVAVTGFDGPIVVTVSGTGSPAFRIDGAGNWVNSGTINPGQTLQLRMTTSTASSGSRVATVNVGSLDVTWSVATKAASSNGPPAEILSFSATQGANTLQNGAITIMQDVALLIEGEVANADQCVIDGKTLTVRNSPSGSLERITLDQFYFDVGTHAFEIACSGPGSSTPDIVSFNLTVVANPQNPKPDAPDLSGLIAYVNPSQPANFMQQNAVLSFARDQTVYYAFEVSDAEQCFLNDGYNNSPTNPANNTGSWAPYQFPEGNYQYIFYCVGYGGISERQIVEFHVSGPSSPVPTPPADPAQIADEYTFAIDVNTNSLKVIPDSPTSSTLGRFVMTLASDGSYAYLGEVDGSGTWSSAPLEYELGDYNADGLEDIFIKDIAVSGGGDYIVYANRFGLRPAQMVRVDQQFLKFFDELYSTTMNPTYIQDVGTNESYEESYFGFFPIRSCFATVTLGSNGADANFGCYIDWFGFNLTITYDFLVKHLPNGTYDTFHPLTTTNFASILSNVMNNEVLPADATGQEYARILSIVLGAPYLGGVFNGEVVPDEVNVVPGLLDAYRLSKSVESLRELYEDILGKESGPGIDPPFKVLEEVEIIAKAVDVLEILDSKRAPGDPEPVLSKEDKEYVEEANDLCGEDAYQHHPIGSSICAKVSEVLADIVSGEILTAGIDFDLIDFFPSICGVDGDFVLIGSETGPAEDVHALGMAQIPSLGCVLVLWSRIEIERAKWQFHRYIHGDHQYDTMQMPICYGAETNCSIQTVYQIIMNNRKFQAPFMAPTINPQLDPGPWGDFVANCGEPPDNYPFKPDGPVVHNAYHCLGPAGFGSGLSPSPNYNPIRFAVGAPGINCNQNITQPGHVFEGVVGRCVRLDTATGNVFVETIGTGHGALPAFNEWAGTMLFENLDEGLRRKFLSLNPQF